MLEKPQIVESEAVETAVLRFNIPRNDIKSVVGPGIGDVMSAATSQGVGPIGPVFSQHFKMDPERFDFEVGVPVNAPVAETGRVKPGKLPAMKVARTIYQGPYEGLGEAWGEFD